MFSINEFDENPKPKPKKKKIKYTKQTNKNTWEHVSYTQKTLINNWLISLGQSI